MPAYTQAERLGLPGQRPDYVAEAQVSDLVYPTLVSLADAKLQLNVDHSEDDGLIQTYVNSAYHQIETYTGTRLILRKLRASYTRRGSELPPSVAVPDGVNELDLEVGNLGTQIDYANFNFKLLARDGKITQWTQSNYKFAEGDAGFGVKVFPSSDDWPDSVKHAGAFAHIVYCPKVLTAGSSLARETIKQVVLMLAAGAYEARESESSGFEIKANPALVRMLLPITRHGRVGIL